MSGVNFLFPSHTWNSQVNCCGLVCAELFVVLFLLAFEKNTPNIPVIGSRTSQPQSGGSTRYMDILLGKIQYRMLQVTF